MTAFALTIKCGLVSDRIPPMAGSLKEWEAVILSCLNNNAKSEVSRRRGVIFAMNMLYRRTFIHTTDSYIGISAELTKPGE